MIYNNILEAVGHTPMVRLNHMVDDSMAVSYTHLTLPTKA